MDWFERLTGFAETGYNDTRNRLVVDGSALRSLVNGRGFGIGTFELASLASLRDRVRTSRGPDSPLRVVNISGDVRAMHAMPEHAGAVFQVASQFNMLEMAGPDVTPEGGVSGDAHDRTQGPACALAAGAATIYRNYFVPVGGNIGQTRRHQLDGLAELGAALGLPPAQLWTMRNGYALCTRKSLAVINTHLAGLAAQDRDTLRGLLRVGLHSDVEVTDATGHRPPAPNSDPGVLLGAAGGLHPGAGSPVAPTWATGAGGRRRGHLVRCGAECPARGIQHRVADLPGGWRFWQRRRLDRRCHAPRPGAGCWLGFAGSAGQPRHAAEIHGGDRADIRVNPPPWPLAQTRPAQGQSHLPPRRLLGTTASLQVAVWTRATRTRRPSTRRPLGVLPVGRQRPSGLSRQGAKHPGWVAVDPAQPHHGDTDPAAMPRSSGCFVLRVQRPGAAAGGIKNHGLDHRTIGLASHQVV